MEAVLQLPTPTRYTNPVHADERTGPWASVAEACEKVEREVRVPGLLVMIAGLGYHWWPGPGLEDTDLIAYQAAEAFQPIAENEFGNHPAFTTQHSLNAYLLGQSSHTGSVFDGGYAWLTEDEQLIVTEDAE